MNKTLKLLLAANVFFIVAAGLIGPIYALFVEEIGGDYLAAGSAYAAFSIAAGGLMFFISRWEDHVKHKEKLVVGGWALSCVGFFSYGLVQNPSQLVVVQAILGIAMAVTTPAYDAMYSEYLDKGKFASEWGLWETTYYIVTAFAALFGGAIVQAWGFPTLFNLMFLSSLVGLALSVLLV
jgi:MFS family permease